VTSETARRDSSPSSELKAESSVDNEVASLMDTINQKGDIVDPLLKLLSDKQRINSSGLKMKQIFLEVILTKYGGRSLEHISEGIRKVKPILDEHYLGEEEA
jgi:hypothetical protein